MPSIWRTISASSSRLLNRSSTIRTVLRCARAKASSEIDAGARRPSGSAVMDPSGWLSSASRPISKNDAIRRATRRPTASTVLRRGSAAASDARACGSGDVGRRPVVRHKRPAREHRARPDIEWSGREDSNFRPPAPHAGALPGCATPRPNRRLYRLRAVSVARSSWRISSSSCRISAGSSVCVGRHGDDRGRGLVRRARGGARLERLRTRAGGARR